MEYCWWCIGSCVICDAYDDWTCLCSVYRQVRLSVFCASTEIGIIFSDDDDYEEYYDEVAKTKYGANEM